jgi:hypothetical protein
MKFSLGAKLYVTLVPLIASAAITAAVTRVSLNSNAQELIAARQLKERAVETLSLLLMQDDASKALLIDMENASAGERKIGAYDAMQASFQTMLAGTHHPELTQLIQSLEKIDKDELRPLDTRILELMAEEKSPEARKIYFNEYEPIRLRFETGVRELINLAEHQAVIAAQHMAEKNRRAFVVLCVCLLSGLILVAAILLVVTRHVVARLRQTVLTLEAASAVTTESTVQLEEASDSVADGANRQAASLQETSAALEEVSQSTRSNADSANDAKTLASQTRTSAEASTTDMTELVRAMNELRACSTGVNQIVKTIEEIAFQTNILALNAAVEAARAGEAGRGFAVVADEVRTLAQRSTNAARETAEQIQNSLQKGERGAELCAKVATTLKSMTAHAREVDNIVAKIAGSCQAQSTGLSQLSSNVMSIDSITQSNAAAAEESASTARALASRTRELAHTIDSLQELIYGARAKKMQAKAAAAKIGPAPELVAAA